MPTIKSRAITGRKPLYVPNDASAELSVIDFDFPTVAPIIGDLWQICELPIGVKVLDWSIVFPKIDSNGTPLLAYSLGVENAAGTDLGTEVWATGLTAGRTTTIDRNTTSLAMAGDASVVRRVSIKITAVAATWGGAGRVGQVALQMQA